MSAGDALTNAMMRALSASLHIHHGTVARLHGDHTAINLFDLAADARGWRLRETCGREKQGNCGGAERLTRHIRLVHYEHPPDLAPANEPVAIRRITPIRAGYSSLFLEQIGFDQRPQLRRYFRTHAEPQLEATYRLMQQHPKAVRCP